jgi:signal transduction histidine kinase
VGLAEFIRDNLNEIEKEWEEFAETLTPSAALLNISALRDHLPEILDVIATDIDRSSRQRQMDGNKCMDRERLDRIAARHAAMRLNSGFDLEQIIQEYSALRVSVSRLWLRSLQGQEQPNLYELCRFNACIDQVIAQMVQHYAIDSTKYGDRFVSILVHDLRSPLNIINIAAYALLEAGALPEAQVNNISRIFRGVQRIDRLINDLAVAVHSRVGSPLPLTKAKADLGVICEQVVAEVKASHANVVMTTRRSGNLTGEWDSERIAQVVFNLVDNAIIHASTKKVEVIAQDAGSAVMLKVCNQESPIPAAMLDSIFEPLVHNSDSTLRDLSSGLGLGLFIVREIVTAHRGTIHVASSESEGTIFTVRLPRASASD